MDDKLDNKDIFQQVKKLEEINKMLTALHWISAQIASEQEIKTMYNLIINGFSEITGLDKCGFYLVDENDQFLELVVRNKEEEDAFWLCNGVVNAFKQALQEREGIINLSEKYCIECPRKNDCTVCLHTCTLFDRSGKPTGLLAGFEQEKCSLKEDRTKILELYTLQISLALENAILNNKLRGLAITDGLTGLYNHRYFFECLERELGKSKKGNEPLSLLFADVDDFKTYNDSFGHQEGDKVLEVVATVMKNMVKGFGWAFRYGGEEFTVILPQHDIQKAYNLANQICSNIAEYPFKCRNVSISVGVAEYPKNSNSLSELLYSADKALYYAKSHGKNKAIIFNSTVISDLNQR